MFCTAFVHSFEIEKSNLRHRETHQQCKTKSYLGAIHKYLLKDQRKGGREGGQKHQMNWIYNLQKSISRLMFAGYTGSKNLV